MTATFPVIASAGSGPAAALALNLSTDSNACKSQDKQAFIDEARDLLGVTHSAFEAHEERRSDISREIDDSSSFESFPLLPKDRIE
ncbi:hypothetical protein P175DRAFT_0533056 [Aspergillus ochraceoroseus IBT 24754]|uniref:Uncharacterized protein n=1 Tax=Aspergillus ochraceoroseus IBT 24754 TaxID=1392256 RepID=A0A2T5LUW9_9EURO|nr:uncharacterized protein P175DRAFT_0533056 [Aspergillus ochraceoroseus IBT 24754]PTU20082.1 hypothetical protein P175DRAFT_0533056 [Aspergillus ochraceoroseus IBT 24754]